MKVLVIPDIHGSTHWKKNFLDNIDEVNKVCLLGDFVDSFNASEKGELAAKNFEDIIETTEPYKKKTSICLGNHDIGYIFQYHGDPHISGHQNEMSIRYNDMFVAAKDRLCIAVKCGKWVLSHAGFTNDWYETTKTGYDIIFGRHGEKVPSGPIRLANWMWKKDKDIRMLNFSDYGWDPSGDDICQGPLWVRPQSLLKDAYYKWQIVGHTEVKTDKPLWIKKGKNNVIVVDSPSHDKFLIVDTEDDDYTASQCIIKSLD